MTATTGVPVAVARRGFLSEPGRLIDLIRWAGTWTAVAALTELVLLRIGTRTALHIPGAFSEPFRVVAAAGRLAFLLAVVLAALTLALLVVELAHVSWLPGAAAAVFLVTATVVAVRSVPADTDALTVVSVAAVVILAVRAMVGLGGSARVPLLLFTLAVGMAGLQAAGVGDAGLLLDLAEGLAVAAAISAPALVGGLGRRAGIWGAVAGLVVLLALGPMGATTKILLLWNFGLAGALPAPLYAVAVGVLLATMVSALGGDRRVVLVPLVLIGIGGIAPQSTYQTALVIIGLGLLVLVKGDGAPVAAARPGAHGPRAGRLRR